MYLAPLNYDRFFKKVFSEPNIAKHFLEDFLDVSIQDIKPLKEKHSLTDTSRTVEFDYRCKIDNSYVVIDMQQWYKNDLAQRFFVYHSLGTVLQLEKIPTTIVDISPELKPIKVKDYSYIEPVYTLIWMVDDMFGFSEDYTSYLMTPEVVTEFLQSKELWRDEQVKALLSERAKLLKVIDNAQMSFLSKSKLVFMYQKNIVKNNKLTKYRRWFQFAEKTKNKKNTSSDFQEYRNDPVFEDVIKRLKQDQLSKEEERYTKDQEYYLAGIERYHQSVLKKGMAKGIEQGIEIGKEQGIEIGREQESKRSDVKIRRASHKKALRTAINLKKKGSDIGFIASVVELENGYLERFLQKVVSSQNLLEE